VNDEVWLESYDIFAEAGALHTAIVENFFITTGREGIITVGFTTVKGFARVNA